MGISYMGMGMVDEQQVIDTARVAAADFYSHKDLQFISSYWDYEIRSWFVEILVGSDLVTEWQVFEEDNGFLSATLERRSPQLPQQF